MPFKLENKPFKQKSSAEESKEAKKARNELYMVKNSSGYTYSGGRKQREKDVKVAEARLKAAQSQ